MTETDLVTRHSPVTRHSSPVTHMIFMSQSGLTESAREPDWDGWYVEHLNIMVTVPGVTSAQRFKTTTPSHPPSLALYSIASPNVFQDPYYLSVRGMGEWLSLIDKQYYRRNLFEGLERAPEVAEHEVLLVADRAQPEPASAAIEWRWLACVGIDWSTPYRGLAVVDRAIADRVGAGQDIALYTPVTTCHKAR